MTWKRKKRNQLRHLKPLGPKVRETASASLSIPACKPSLHSLSKDILLGPALTRKLLKIRGFLHNPQTLCSPFRFYNSSIIRCSNSNTKFTELHIHVCDKWNILLQKRKTAAEERGLKKSKETSAAKPTRKKVKPLIATVKSKSPSSWN